MSLNEDEINELAGGPYNQQSYLVRAVATICIPKRVVSEGKESVLDYVRGDVEELANSWDDMEMTDKGWNRNTGHYEYNYDVSAIIEAEDEPDAENQAQDMVSSNTMLRIIEVDRA